MRRCSFNKNVSIPIELYKALRGEYFVGSTEHLPFGNGAGAWACLFNPKNSKVNLHIDFWHITDVSTSPFVAAFWFNTDPPGIPEESMSVASANTSIRRMRMPKCKLQFSLNTSALPIGGVNVFERYGCPSAQLTERPNGSFIFPPGGSFLIYLSAKKTLVCCSAKISFGWWEEKTHCDFLD